MVNLYIKDINEWKCAFCNSDVDEGDHQLNPITVRKLFVNGLLSGGDGDQFSINFINREDENLDQYDQYICEDCIIPNPNERLALTQPYFLEPKIFTMDFIKAHHKDAVIKGFIDKDIMKTNGQFFHDIITSLGQNNIVKRRNFDDMLKAHEKTMVDIEEHAVFTYSGKQLFNLTGLRQADFDEIVTFVKPFQTIFRSVTVEEVVTLCFAYMRYLAKYNS